MRRSLSIINRWWYLGVVVMIFGCGMTEPRGCDPCFTTAVVNVSVSDSAGQPVAGIGLLIRTYLQICGLDLRGGESGFVTRSDGRRRLLISSGYSPHVAQCITLTVNPDLNPAFPSATKDFQVNLAFRVEDDTPRDSVRLDIVIP